MANGDKPTIQERFEAYHREHPEVYDQLVALAQRARARGRARVGIGSLFEVLRWERQIEGGEGGFKLNNDLRSRYAREIMGRERTLAGIFETRTLTAD